VANSCGNGRKKAVSGHFSLLSKQVLTEWRWTQSRANFSPPLFPANREKYRELRALVDWNSRETPIRKGFRRKLRICEKSKQGINRRGNRECRTDHQGKRRF